jgi:hypothetical protein
VNGTDTQQLNDKFYGDKLSKILGLQKQKEKYFRKLKNTMKIII